MPFSFLTFFSNTKTYSKPSHFPQDTNPVFFPLRYFNSLLLGTQVVLTSSPAPLQKYAGGQSQAVSQTDSIQAGGSGVLQTTQQRKWTWAAPPFHHTAVAPGRHVFISYQQGAKARRELDPPAFPRRWFHCQRLVMLSTVLGSFHSTVAFQHLPASF